MTRSEREIPLAGGNVNTDVVKVGDTVRRATTPHSPTIHRLLKHLEIRGYLYAPRFLGLDQKGREILTFLDGSADLPADLWETETALIKTAQMLRELHDATKDWEPLAGESWAYTHTPEDTNDVIGHNDFAPYNMIFADGQPIGIIDFDLSGPAPRHRDLAYLAYWMVPLSFGKTDMAPFAHADLKQGCPRLRTLCNHYGTEDIQGLLDMVSNVLDHMGSHAAAQKMVGAEAAVRLKDGGHFQHWQDEAAAFQKMRTSFNML